MHIYTYVDSEHEKKHAISYFNCLNTLSYSLLLLPPEPRLFHHIAYSPFIAYVNLKHLGQP